MASKIIMVPTMASLEFQEEGSFLGGGENGGWELVDNADADYSDDSFSVSSLPNDMDSWDSSSIDSSSATPSSSLFPKLINREQETNQDPDDYEPFIDDDDVVEEDNVRDDAFVEGRMFDLDNLGDRYNRHGYIEAEEEDEDEEDDDSDDSDGYDLDDELVPRSVSGKLGRQRMRKLGSRPFKKMNMSKRSPYLYVKPGCVHGKHGLGMKHSL